MNQFFDDTMQGLLEAVEIEKGEYSTDKKENMPVATFIAADRERELIDESLSLEKSKTYFYRTETGWYLSIYYVII